MEMEAIIKSGVIAAVKELYSADLALDGISLNDTIKDYAGDLTVVVFPLTRISKQGPEPTGEAIGNYLKEHLDIVEDFNVVKGFLNLVLADNFWLNFLMENLVKKDFGKGNNQGTVVLEYCGPNTNKPLHLGHIRNMLLGYSTANLLQFSGKKVHKVNIYNDRGIAICKSMLAWKKFGKGETPESTNTKGDHFVGRFYVEFDQQNRKQIEALIKEGKSKEEAEKQTPLLLEAREMLVKWEQGDKETIALWEMMNAWCYDGFEETFKALGVDFEKHYKESDYYMRGKELVDEGLKNGEFYQKDDGSIWVDLEDVGLDHKLLLRSDGTSVYITQDMGIAEARFQDYAFDESIYVVASEQDYHFKVLQLILEKMNKSYAKGIYHLSYGLVNLPDGRMKSREGTVVDADDLIEGMIATAEAHTKELGKVDDFTEAEAKALYKKLALGALKYFILKINPKRSVIFNPEESIDFQGNTGPFIQFNYVRIQSLLRKQDIGAIAYDQVVLTPEEKELLKDLHKFPQVIQSAAKNYDISELTSFSYNLAKTFSKFYANTSILSDTDENTKFFRLQLSKWTGDLLQTSFEIIGVEMPDRM